MKNLLPVSIYCLFFSWLSLSWVPVKNNSTAGLSVLHDSTSLHTAKNEALNLYNLMELEQKGLSKAAFEYAYIGYQQLLEKQLLEKPDYLTICDFSQSSNNKRLYLVDMASHLVELTTYVAHGRNSGGEFATQFSNKPESLQSSLGFYITNNTYYGEHGLSLRITGVEPGINDKAYQRSIVVHGADYIEEDWLKNSTYMGRSYGCPAVPKKESEKIINTIKNGTCLFIYHPSARYLNGSKILNG